MIEGKDIICIANTTWFGEYTKSTVQIMSRLAKKNRVVFVEYPFTWKDVITTFLKKQKAPVSQMLGLKKRLSLISPDTSDELYKLVIPPVLPVDFLKNDSVFRFFFGFNTFLYKRQIQKAIKKLGIKNPLVITAYNPFYGLSMIGKLKENRNVYYCYDGIGTRRHGQRIFGIDEAFTKKADAVITTSDFLNADKEKLNSSSFVVKNGVDYDTFRAHAKKDIVRNARKTVGYIGSLDHRFDIDTVEFAVNKLKDFDFHFTGNLRNLSIKQRLEKYPNVTFFAPIPPDDVPALLATYDVGIIPYLVNDINKNIYPLKINEYMAVGVPVVMTSFADLPDFYEVVSSSKTQEEFVQKLVLEIENDNKTLISERIEFAKSNSWDIKAEEFGSILKRVLEDGNRN